MRTDSPVRRVATRASVLLEHGRRSGRRRASHGLIEYLDELASRPGRQLTYSVGWDLSARERTAIRLVPRQGLAERH